MSAKTRTQKNKLEFENASKFFPTETFDKEAYLRRTARNRLWVGGEAGQLHVHELKIAVAGLGGMGSHIAELFARLGVGHLRIADPDTIEVTNINRQVIANQNTVGLRKAEASENELRSIAKDFELVSYHDGVTAENVDEFVEGCDAIIDEVDVFPLEVHVLLHQAARRRGIPIYSAYVVGMGIHFYKFEGNDYTFEDFLGGERSRKEWKRPSADFLLDRIGQPLPKYIGQPELDGYRREISQGGAPIFGPATLFGHSMVATRVFLDLFRKKSPKSLGTVAFSEKTPTMPEFLVLDPCEMTLKKARMGKYEG